MLAFTITLAATVVVSVTAVTIPLVSGLIRRSTEFNTTTSLSSNGSGAKKAGNSKAGAPVPFSCTLTFPSIGGSILYNPARPFNLLDIQFVAEALAECTIPMLSITATISAVDWVQVPHLVAAGECVECPVLTTTPTGYICVQTPIGGQCDGEWDWKVQAQFVAPPEWLFDVGTGGCVARGTIASCNVVFPATTEAIPLLNVNTAAWNLPPGVVEPPIFDTRGIENIRNTHFRGGGAVDPSKGLFNAELTDVDLEELFLEGMEHGNPFVRNNVGNFEKTFPKTGIGRSSNGRPSIETTIVINVSEFVTIFPR